MKKLYIAGNWKMNTDAGEAIELINGINAKLKGYQIKGNIKIIVCPPFINIPSVVDSLKGNDNIEVGAQNCHYEAKGAFTGEVSIPMLKYYGCKYCIVGHSERRQYFSEDNSFINKKITALLKEDVRPILCIGETLQERQSNLTFDVLKKQLDECLLGVSNEDMEKIIIAYEPIWAIGTGVTATTEQIDETHNYLRNYFVGKYSNSGKNVIIQYGGSVNDKNAAEIFNIENVNGALIGGASLKAEQFFNIIDSGNKI